MKDRNENRPGYKQTKVGWIPKEWKDEKLSNSGFKVIDGDRGKNYPKQSDFFSSEYCLFLNAGNVTTSGFCFKTMKFITKERDTLLGKGKLKRRDLIVTTRGTIGNFAYYDDDILHQNVRINSGMAIIRSTTTEVHTKYILRFFRSPLFESELKRVTFGSAVPQLTISLIQNFKIPLPPLPEQEVIAEVLGCWDEGIQRLKDLVEQKQLRKKGLMQKLLTGEKRLPAFQKSEDGGQKAENNKHRFFDYPQDWTLPQIKEVAIDCTERNKNKEPVTVLSCSKHRGFVESSKYFGKQIFSDDTSNYKVIHRGEFGFPSNHIEEGSIGLLTTHDKGIVSPIYTVFKINEDMLPEYLIALFKTETYRHIFEITTNGSVDRRGSLRWNDFKLIRIPKPSLAEQQAIAEVLATADGEIELLATELDALREQKKGLMQKLLTGEVRCPEFRDRHVA